MRKLFDDGYVMSATRWAISILENPTPAPIDGVRRNHLSDFAKRCAKAQSTQRTKPPGTRAG